MERPGQVVWHLELRVVLVHCLGREVWEHLEPGEPFWHRLEDALKELLERRHQE